MGPPDDITVKPFEPDRQEHEDHRVGGDRKRFKHARRRRSWSLDRLRQFREQDLRGLLERHPRDEVPDPQPCQVEDG